MQQDWLVVEVDLFAWGILDDTSSLVLTGNVMFSLWMKQVLSADGQNQVGRISKQWTGLVKEAFTDADNFGITCKLLS